MVAAVCAIWFGWAVWAVPNLHPGYYGQPSAVLWEDQLFVASNTPQGSALYRGRVWPGKGADKPAEYFCGVRTEHANQAQLEIRNDRVLIATPGDGYHIVPLIDVPCLEGSAFGKRLRQLRGFQSLSDMLHFYFGNERGRSLLFPRHRRPDVAAPLVEIREELARDAEGVKNWREIFYTDAARFSIELSGPRSVRLFHAYHDSLFVSVEPDYLNNWYLDDEGTVKKNPPKPPERELRTGRLPADFMEYFVAYTSEKRDYLVTPNGKVYMSVPKGKTEVDVTAVWDDPKRRIVGVVQDSAGNAVYGWGFVTDSGAPERFYVKLGPKPVAVPYKLTVPLWGDRSHAYLESYECARAFRKK